MNRREFVAVAATAVLGTPARAEAGKKLGAVIHSFGIRAAAERGRDGKPNFSDPLVFLDYCRQLGLAGIQVSIGSRDGAYIAKLRERLEAGGMYLEGSIRVPRDSGDVDRFDADVRTARDAGATVLRTVTLGGRRYETFKTAAAFRDWTELATRSLKLAEPVVAKHRLRLAVENHKDWRTEEQVALLKRFDSPHIGVCVDTGNNIALLEDVLETVEALAPWAYSVHLKDMAVAEYEDGFLLSEVPLGEGCLDLRKIVATLRRARPEIQFNLEMITRNPLRVPCLKPDYWATFDGLSGKQLARSLTAVRRHQPKQPLPRLDGLSREKQLVVEEENVKKSLAYAQQHLGL